MAIQLSYPPSYSITTTPTQINQHSLTGDGSVADSQQSVTDPGVTQSELEGRCRLYAQRAFKESVCVMRYVDGLCRRGLMNEGDMSHLLVWVQGCQGEEGSNGTVGTSNGSGQGGGGGGKRSTHSSSCDEGDVIGGMEEEEEEKGKDEGGAGEGDGWVKGKKNGEERRGKRRMIEAEVQSDDGTEYMDAKRYKKSGMVLSAAMAEFIGKDVAQGAGRDFCAMKILEYARENNLISNKINSKRTKKVETIRPDERLGALFGASRPWLPASTAKLKAMCKTLGLVRHYHFSSK
eukprot:GHVQ01003859.1.p2 GENE.GHVQ01003859.1~~GHVQ01003859.1.p2  ORF type:complete len:291 (+),score=68.00 GHVQ01003859.1:1129-2001(+)